MTQTSQPAALTVRYPQLSSKTVASFLLICAFFILAFSNIRGGAQFSQAAGAGLFIAAGLIAAIGLPRTLPPLNIFELAMLASSLLSGAVCLTRSSELSTVYTILLPAVVLSSSVIVRTFTLDEIFRLAAKSQALICAIVVPFHWKKLLVALDPRSADRWMLRVAPFDMHPNLVGFAYGIGALVAVYAAIRSKGAWRTIYSATAAASVALVLGASARAGLLALAASGAVILLVSYPKLPRTWKIATVGAAALISAMALVYWLKIYTYLEILLELNSNTRGLSSGGSGRADAWSRGIETIISSGSQLFFGSGLRSSSLEDIGFYTENSYINILIESGVVLGGFLISIILGGIARTLAAGRRSPKFSLELYACSAVIMFAVIQSVFNRYLIGIGNFGSLFLILTYNYAWSAALGRKASNNKSLAPVFAR
ncbi:MAG: O-antigen ligase family protein [Pseudomonadota bacterium]